MLISGKNDRVVKSGEHFHDPKSKPAKTEGHSFNDTSSYKLKAYDCCLVDTRQQQQQQQQK